MLGPERKPEYTGNLDAAGTATSVRCLIVRFGRRARAGEVAVAVDVVDAGDGRPVLVLARAGQREEGPLLRVGPLPVRRDEQVPWCAAHWPGRCPRTPPTPPRFPRSPRESPASPRRSDRARPSIRSPSARSSRCPAPESDIVGAWNPKSIEPLGDIFDADRGRMTPSKCRQSMMNSCATNPFSPVYSTGYVSPV